MISAPGTSIHGLAFDRNANTSPFITSDTSAFPFAIPPARHSITNGGSGDDLGADRPVLTPDNDRNSIFVYGDYDVADNFSVFGQFMQGTNKTSRWNSPGGSFHGTPTALTVFQDNAFLSDDLRQTMMNEGINSFTFKRMGALEDTGGQSQIWDENEMTSITVGFNWDIEGGAFDGWSVDAYYQDGENERRWYQHGLRVDRIHAAFDAVVDPNTGNTVCRVSLFGDAFPGCQPINLFGRGNASPEALDYVMGYEAGQTITTPLFFADTGFDLGQSATYTSGIAKTYNTNIDQQLFEISANGEVFQNWAPGPISLAVGYTNREEEILQIVHAPTTNAASDHTNYRPVSCNDESIGLRGVSVPDCLNTVGMQYSKVSNIQGTIEVDELFAETLIPLINGGDAIESANLSLATRWADYSGSGEVWAYKGGLDIQINDELRLRGTFSRDVRAANLSERFDKTGGIATIMDPQFGGETYSVTRFSGGNPLVEPEEADTFTAGFVYQPSFLDGFSMSIDWYDIEIDGAIGQLGVQAVINQCEAGAQNLCSLITRNPDDNRLVLVGDVFVNVDQSIVQGVDMEFTYRTDVDWIGGDTESLGFRLFGSYLGERSEKNAGAPKIDRAGQTGIQQSDGAAYALPEWRWTGNVTYNFGPFSAFLQGRYIGEGVNESALVEGVDISDNGVDSAFYVDLNLRYAHEMSNGVTVELFGNITNLTDKNPPVTPYFSAFTGFVTQTNTSLFDVLGRRYTAGVRVNF